MTSENFTTLHTYDTAYNADSVEWCPISPFQNYFVCGTYQLVKKTNCSSDESEKRLGSVLLFCVNGHELEKKCEIETAAVLDMKWCSYRVAGNIALGVAHSNGEIRVFYLCDGYLVLVTKCSLKKYGGDFLFLSLDWSKNSNDNILCLSDSKGDVTLFKFIDGNLKVYKEWNSHSLEAWTVCFDIFNPQIVFSGGDDAKLNVWDIRMEEPNKIAASRKHNSGVTVLSFNPTKEFCLASGSYDETVFIWDTRNFRQPAHIFNASGGLWRLKWEPTNEPHRLLAACIYGGFQVIEPYIPCCVGQYKEHESLAYGADWCHLRDFQNSVGKFLIATCSFYDQKLCVSIWDENKYIVDY